MNELQKLLDGMGITDTRRFQVEHALEACHSAFAPLDDTNRKLVVKKLPFLAQCARFYGLHSVACNTFEFEGIVMPDNLYGISCEVSVFDDGTLDYCVSIKNAITERETVLRYDSEYRSTFDTEDDFLSSAFADFSEQLDGFLQHHSNF